MGWSFAGTRQFIFAGQPTNAVSDGNNVAWCCPCGAPLLFVYLNGRAGSAANSPRECNHCGESYYLRPEYGELAEPRDRSEAPAEIMEIVLRDEHLQ